MLDAGCARVGHDANARATRARRTPAHSRSPFLSVPFPARKTDELMKSGKQRSAMSYTDFHSILTDEFKNDSGSLWLDFKVCPGEGNAGGPGSSGLALSCALALVGHRQCLNVRSTRVVFRPGLRRLLHSLSAHDGRGGQASRRAGALRKRREKEAFPRSPTAASPVPWAHLSFFYLRRPCAAGGWPTGYSAICCGLTLLSST